MGMNITKEDAELTLVALRDAISGRKALIQAYKKSSCPDPNGYARKTIEKTNEHIKRYGVFNAKLRTQLNQCQ